MRQVIKYPNYGTDPVNGMLNRAIPNYCSSLDAMAGAEATLTKFEQDAMVGKMLETVVAPFEAEFGVELNDQDAFWTVFHSTDEQRAIAFLATASAQNAPTSPL